VLQPPFDGFRRIALARRCGEGHSHAQPIVPPVANSDPAAGCRWFSSHGAPASVRRGHARAQPIATAVATSDFATDFGVLPAIPSQEFVMNVVKSTVSASIIVAGALLGGTSAQAACPSISRVQARIVEHANGDVDALRSFVWMTAIIYRINMVDVSNNLDAWRSAVDCRNQAAAAEHVVPVAADAPAADVAGVHVAAR
jgi:hypothetical protein